MSLPKPSALWLPKASMAHDGKPMYDAETARAYGARCFELGESNAGTLLESIVRPGYMIRNADNSAEWLTMANGSLSWAINPERGLSFTRRSHAEALITIAKEAGFAEGASVLFVKPASIWFGDLRKLTETLEALVRGTHDTCPTRQPCNPADNELAAKVDEWWMSYFDSLDKTTKRIARSALNLVRSMRIVVDAAPGTAIHKQMLTRDDSFQCAMDKSEPMSFREQVEAEYWFAQGWSSALNEGADDVFGKSTPSTIKQIGEALGGASDVMTQERWDLLIATGFSVECFGQARWKWKLTRDGWVRYAPEFLPDAASAWSGANDFAVSESLL